jgi:hypothetical protein
MGFLPSYGSASHLAWVAPFRTSSVMPSLQMIRSLRTRKARRGRPWQLHPTVPGQSIGWCTLLLAPPTSRISRTSSSSGLPAHLSVCTSRQHQKLYLHHWPCYVYRHHPLWEPPPATPTSTVVTRATLLESALLQRRTQLKAPPTFHHMVNRRWLLPERVASTNRGLVIILAN